MSCDPEPESRKIDGAADADRKALVAALRACGSQDQGAFRHVYGLTSAKLFGVCLRICGERQAAEEVLQQVYLIVWRRAASFDPSRASPITWLATIARNRAIDWRRANRNVAGELGEADGHLSPVYPLDQSLAADEILIREQEVRRMQEALLTVDETARSAIRDAFLNGLTYRELAIQAGVPLPTMKSIVRRALLRLRAVLAD